MIVDLKSQIDYDLDDAVAYGNAVTQRKGATYRVRPPFIMHKFNVIHVMLLAEK